jgi:hypothetical protein
MQSLQKKLVTSPVLAVDAPAKAPAALKRGMSVEAMPQIGPQTDRQRMASIAKLRQHLVRVEAEGAKPKQAPNTAPAKRSSVEAQAAFNVNSQAQIFYGSVVAFESLDGWFLCLHPRSGVVSVREPEAHWAEKGVMPFRKSKSLGGSSKEPPVFLFKLIHLANPMYNGPVRFGDPVWFQVRFYSMHVSDLLVIVYAYSTTYADIPRTWRGRVDHRKHSCAVYAEGY